MYMSANLTKIEMISIYVAVITISLLLIVFILQILNFYRVYKRLVNGKLEDERLLDELIKEDKKYFILTEEIVNDPNLEKGVKKEKIVKYSEFKKRYKKKKSFICIIGSILLYAALIAICGGVIYTKAKKDNIFINNKSALVIKTSSMETINESNNYLIERKIENQIPAFSLIVIEKVDVNDIQVDDIVAFKDVKNDRILVHRAYKIENGKFTFKGDANAGSLDSEIDVTPDLIIGRYTGYNSYTLGLIYTFLTSYVGLITLIGAILLLIYYEFLSSKIEKLEYLRKVELVEFITNDINYAIYEDREIHYVSEKNSKEIINNENLIVDNNLNEEIIEEVTEEGNAEANQSDEVVEEELDEAVEENLDDVDDEEIDDNQSDEALDDSDEEDLDEALIDDNGTNLNVRLRIKSKSFKEKLMLSDDRLKEMYNDLKNYILRYKVSNRLSRSFDTFSYKRKKLVRINVIGKSIRLYMAFDPKDFEETKYPFKDVSDKKRYVETPFMFKVKSELSFRRAKKLIDQIINENQVGQKRSFNEADWIKELMDTENK